MIVDQWIILILCIIFIVITILIHRKNKRPFDGDYIIYVIISAMMANSFYVGLGYLDSALGLGILDKALYEHMISTIIIGILMILLSIYFLVKLRRKEK
ncbi:MAG: hypothetical protein KAT43_04520 [Nanoarchaeota archaeon]|nr:hypothetical protein [Nanoarchaeota archaeon]